MAHEPSSHVADRAPLPAVSGYGPREHIEDIMLAITAMIDKCEPCAGTVAIRIAGDPLRMITLHELMRAFVKEVDGLEMSAAPEGAVAELAALAQESREQMVIEGLVWITHLVGKVNGWWDPVLGVGRR